MNEPGNASTPQGLTMFATGWCPYCVQAESFLKSKGATKISKILIDEEPAERERMLALSGGRRTVPQIFIAGVHIGGCDDLMALGRSKPQELQDLLARAGALA